MTKENRKKNGRTGRSQKQNDKPSSQETPGGQKPGGFSPWTNILLWLIFSALFFLWLLSAENGILSTTPQMDYSEFRQELSRGNVEAIHVQGEQIRYPIP